jgi:hypothetical protein
MRVSRNAGCVCYDCGTGVCLMLFTTGVILLQSNIPLRVVVVVDDNRNNSRSSSTFSYRNVRCARVRIEPMHVVAQPSSVTHWMSG